MTFIAVADWLAERRAASGLEVRQIAWAESREWRFDAGVLVHATGGFFSIAGVKVASNAPALDGLAQPMILQPEIGLLGFLADVSGSETRWLLQAKAEPGNVGGVQIGPTVQATQSNYMRLHGGAPTPYLDLFDPGAPLASDSRQSEQGTRFLGKYNRNAVRTLDAPVDPADSDYGWFSSTDLRAALAADYAVNTDARSVLATAPWRLVAPDRSPFAPIAGESAFRAQLRRSYQQAKPETADQALARLAALSSAVEVRAEVVDLGELPGWRITHDAIVSSGAGFDIRAYAVTAPHREVPAWDQPLVRGLEVEAVVLAAQVRSGVLRFALAAAVEPGFSGRLQYGPSYQSTAPSPFAAALGERLAAEDGAVRLSVLQSDEGGRFMTSRSRYSIVELDERETPDEVGVAWVDAAALERLCAQPGVLTNEARSAVSLLLALG